MEVKRTVPKYRRVKQMILAWIEEGRIKPGERIPVERELSAHFAVSRQTVRQAISELTHEGMLDRRQGKGTFCSGGSRSAAGGAARTARTICVITTYISDYIFPHIIRGIEQHLSANGYAIMLLSTQNDPDKERRALESAWERGVDGVILEPTKSMLPNPNLDLFNRLAEAGVAMVWLHAAYDEVCALLVAVDDRRGAEIATWHCWERGHRRIGAIMKIDDRQGVLRLEGYVQALLKAGVPFMPDAIAFYTTETRRAVCRSYANRMAGLPPSGRPTAVVCYNDEIAAQLVHTLRQIGFRVPEEVSVVGFDNSQFAEIGHPALTSVQHPKWEMGVKAAQIILELVEGRLPAGEAAGCLFQPRLVERDSVRRIDAPLTVGSSPPA